MGIIFKRMFKKCGLRTWNGLNWPWVGSSGGFCEHDGEQCDFIQGGEFLIQM